MKITKLELKNFKRFDDLTIDLTSLAEPAKLVLLIGTNGSGKSSVFDAFEYVNKLVRSDIKINDDLSKSSYYNKNTKKKYEIDVTFNDDRSFHSNFFLVNNNEIPDNAFYGRTSFRQVPKLTRTASGQVSVSFEKDSDRPKTFIDYDNRFENDIEKISSSILTDLFGQNSTQQILESYINPINRAFENIFGAEDGLRIRLLSIKPPLDGKIAEILFQKGNSNIQYDYLSSGEKEIFNILLDLLVRKEYFQDAVYFLDEIDLHLNTALQKNLLKEITENWVPNICQLWTASHSLGFIEYANATENAAIIDFDNLNFDVPQVILPSTKNNADIFEIAVSKEFLANIFEGKTLVFSENTDTSLYNNLKIKDTIFLVGRNKADVFFKTKNNANYNGLIDRDYLTDEERNSVLTAYKKLYILDYYSIENYLYHPDNLEEFYHSKGNEFDKTGYMASIKNERKLVRDKILLGILRARESYSFFREEKPKVIRTDEEMILQMLDADDFETFYKVFPAKDYGTGIKERQNLNPADLAKTKWFKAKIEEVLKK
ncbi:AAA family ATPase [Mucilaginibacter gotjawali]|uniref:Energy-coupling factor transporter ATP-binding protein EcfA2 n=1 Tax=Mucilaginibacter gotjawali TaxID=1550579 RepID=A0A839SDP2_9SPHI|nr:AAA family ATPase [Mucilaginibacter gotjawali]MBB3055434.1 energy-coupling factor transporter ATP-binding protein EcfA2 [Mucilaginibacter gotjawali]